MTKAPTDACGALAYAVNSTITCIKNAGCADPSYKASYLSTICTTPGIAELNCQVCSSNGSGAVETDAPTGASGKIAPPTTAPSASPPSASAPTSPIDTDDVVTDAPTSGVAPTIAPTSDTSPMYASVLLSIAAFLII